jgi:hypothetical protein
MAMSDSLGVFGRAVLVNLSGIKRVGIIPIA